MTNYRELKATRELSCLRRLAQVAPDMKLGAAQTLAAEHGTTFAQMMDYSAAMIILSETLLGSNGEILQDENRRPAITWALQRVQDCRASCVCGPCPDDPIEILMQEKDNEWLHRSR